MEGDPAAAQILIAVLMRKSSASAPALQGGADATIVRAAVRSLCVNGSAPARSTLEQILVNEFPTSDDGAAFSEAVDVLTAKPTAFSEAILVSALKQPQAWRQLPAGAPPGPVAPGPRLLGALRTTAPERLRMVLAEAVVGRKVPPAAAENVRAMLLEPAAVNLGPQAVLYGAMEPADSAKQRLEEMFLVYASETMRRVIATSVGSDDPLRAAPIPPSDPLRAVAADLQLVERVNRSLWNTTSQTLCERLQGIESLERQATTLALGLMVPRDNVRASVLRALRMNKQDGPQALRTIFASNGSFFDPGAIVTLKTIFRMTSLSAKFGTVRPGTTQAIKDLMDSRREAGRQNQEWAEFTSQMSANLCSLFNSVSASARPGGEGVRAVGLVTSGGPSVLAQTSFERPSRAKDLPIELNGQARVVARCDLSWPRDAAFQGTVQADATEVHYVRIQQSTANPRALVNHYRTQLSSPAELLQDGGKRLWLDGRPRWPNTGNKLSVDVFLTRSKPGSGPAPDTEERMIVEILTIEIKAPDE